MTTLDITQGEHVVDEIKWCDSTGYNLVREGKEVTICELGVDAMSEDKVSLIGNAEEAENLIKAIQKSIDLGWYE